MTLTIIGLIASLISPIIAMYLYHTNKKFVLELTEKNSELIKQMHSEILSSEKTINIITEFFKNV